LQNLDVPPLQIQRGDIAQEIHVGVAEKQDGLFGQPQGFTRRRDLTLACRVRLAV